MGMKLDNWELVFNGSLRGYVYGSDKFPDGKLIITSTLVDVDLLTDEIITQSGSRYELLNPNPRYEALFPNARQRVIDSLRSAVNDRMLSEMTNV